MNSGDNMLKFFKPGENVYGFCGGSFGRDSYEDKICISVRPLYAVFEDSTGRGYILTLEDIGDPSYVPSMKDKSNSSEFYGG